MSSTTYTEPLTPISKNNKSYIENAWAFILCDQIVKIYSFVNHTEN